VLRRAVCCHNILLNKRLRRFSRRQIGFVFSNWFFDPQINLGAKYDWLCCSKFRFLNLTLNSERRTLNDNKLALFFQTYHFILFRILCLVLRISARRPVNWLHSTSLSTSLFFSNSLTADGRRLTPILVIARPKAAAIFCVISQIDFSPFNIDPFTFKLRHTTYYIRHTNLLYILRTAMRKGGLIFKNLLYTAFLDMPFETADTRR